MEDFQHKLKISPDNKTEVIVEFPASGKIYKATIKNRQYPDEQNQLINGTIFKLVFNAYLEHMKNIVNQQVKEKLEQKNIEVIPVHHGRPKSLFSKNNLSEEKKQYEREKALRHYYKKKQISACA